MPLLLHHRSLRGPFHVWLLSASLTLLPTAVLADDDDWEDDPFEKALAVNEGTLEILENPPDKPAHHHINRLTITVGSLNTGWVGLDQCHYDIDPVPDLDIVYKEGKIRDLRVTRANDIGKATVNDHSVSLEDVGKEAELCISGDTRALSRTEEGYLLKNGPFMRRFLDGFYPMHVTLDIRYPHRLRPTEFSPQPTSGLRYKRRPGNLVMDLWFEGILKTEFLFKEARRP